MYASSKLPFRLSKIQPSNIDEPGQGLPGPLLTDPSTHHCAQADTPLEWGPGRPESAPNQLKRLSSNQIGPNTHTPIIRCHTVAPRTSQLHEHPSIGRAEALRTQRLNAAAHIRRADAIHTDPSSSGGRGHSFGTAASSAVPRTATTIRSPSNQDEGTEQASGFTHKCERSGAGEEMKAPHDCLYLLIT